MARAFFPVIVVVFLIRSFWVEPFKIPSGSMKPTLLVGDFILVNKYIYGIRLPVINKKVIDIDPVRRGDVVVFRYPADPSVDYIKRVIGTPGDRVQYRGKRLTINGEQVGVQGSGFYTDKAEKGFWTLLGRISGYNGKANDPKVRFALYSPQGREKYRELVGQGWTDAIRHLHPDERIYTFWPYWRNAFQRDAGIRIDHALFSPALAKALKAAGVDRTPRGWDKTSDHAPMWVEVEV